MNDIINNIKKFQLYLKNKDMQQFWIIKNRTDFKPLKKIITVKNNKVKTNIHSINELNNDFLKDKGQYYIGKNFVNIKISFNNNVINKIIDFKSLKKYKFNDIITVSVCVYTVNELEKLNIADSWCSDIIYTFDSIKNIKFNLKNIEILVRLVCDKSLMNKKIMYSDICNK